MNAKDFTARQLDNMSLVGTLTAKTAKGKQRIKQWGASGKVMRVVDSIQASPVKGIWFGVAAGDKFWRWVHIDNDVDFNITVHPWNNDDSFLIPSTHATTSGDV